jgi:LysM repeat protein
VTIEQLRGWNGLEPSEVLKAGQRIRVSPPGNAAPGKAGVGSGSSQTVTTHLVRPGDTLSEIAERYDIPEGELRRANRLGANSMIRIGDRLKIPARSS